MIKAADLKKGMVVSLEGRLCQARDIEVKSPSARGAATLYKVRFVDIRGGAKVEQTYKGDDTLEDVALERRAIQFSYLDGDQVNFMDAENYELYTLDKEALAEQLRFISEGLEGMMALLVDGQVISVELPASVDLEIVETAPSIKGASVTGRTKTAVLSTGLEVQVPEYLGTGERVKVNTGTGKYMSRA